MTARQFEAIRKIASLDPVESFDCGNPALNQFLQRHALTAQQSERARTYVCCCDGLVAGCYSLVVGGVERAAAATRIAEGMPQHPVPVMILARLAVNLEHQHAGLEKALLKDALKRTVQAAEIAGIRALLVHAKDEDARKWYLQWEFEPSPTDAFRLYLLMKDLKALLRGVS